jgi:hypothetical protein
VPRPPLDVEVTHPDVARVYVMREEELRGALQPLRVEEGDRAIGVIDRNEFLCWERRPGRTVLSLVHEGRAIEGGDVPSVFALDAEPGRAYYLLVTLDRGEHDPDQTPGRPEVEIVDPEQGRRMLESRTPAPLR